MLGGAGAGEELGSGRISMIADILGPSDLGEILSPLCSAQQGRKAIRRHLFY